MSLTLATSSEAAYRTQVYKLSYKALMDEIHSNYLKAHSGAWDASVSRADEPGNNALKEFLRSGLSAFNTETEVGRCYQRIGICNEALVRMGHDPWEPSGGDTLAVIGLTFLGKLFS